jgi:hypothetical protein
MENSKDEIIDIIVPKGTEEQIEALAAVQSGTKDQITDRLILLGLEAYRAGELNDKGYKGMVDE